MQGGNAIFKTYGGASCFVSNNYYEIYEVPARSNHYKSNLEGKFLLFAKNTDFNYWLVADMFYSINYKSTNKNYYLADSVKINPKGYYTISSNKNQHLVNKTNSGKKCNYGYKNAKGRFDQTGARKKAYGTNFALLTAQISGFSNHSVNQVSDGKPVKKYNNKNKYLPQKHYEKNTLSLLEHKKYY